MKLNLIKLLSLSFLVIAGLTFTSCDPDPCKDVVCDADHGICLDGTCDCDPGYSGSDCAILLRSAYVGTYNAVEVCTSDPSFSDNYTSEVKTSADGDQYMIITNLYNHFSAAAPGAYQPEDTQVKVLVSDAGIEIPEQFWTAAGLESYKVSGTGSVLSGTEFSINFTLTDTDAGGGTDECSVTYTLQ